MKKIRKGIFETNSSSSHSLHIDDKVEVYDTIYPDENGKITLKGGEFGWQWEKYNDALTKANYAAISSSGVDFNLLEKVIKNHTGAKKVEYIGNDTWNSGNYSYIDHDSCGLMSELNDEKSLKNFLFNPRCWLFLGNDNQYSPPYFYDVNEVEYTHKIIVKGTPLNLELKVDEYPEGESLAKKLDRLMDKIYYDKYLDKWYEGQYMSSDKLFEYGYNSFDEKLKTITLYKGGQMGASYEISRKDSPYEKGSDEFYKWLHKKADEYRKLPENHIILSYEIVKI